MLLKIGELAKRIGLTIRALHHYEAIGLVTPSARSEAGYRLYDRNDIARLHSIQALRGLGLSLAEIGAVLDGDGTDLRGVIRQQIGALGQQIEQAADLRDRLTALDTQLAGDKEPDLDEWLSTLGMMAMYRKYLTHEELVALSERKSKLNEQWPGLVAEIRTLMDRKVPPKNAEAKKLAARWMELQKKTMGDDPRFIVKLSAMHRTEFKAQTLTGVDGPLLDFIMLAGHESRCDLYAEYLSPVELDKYRKNWPQYMHEWLGLFAEARQLMENAVAPEDAVAQSLFERWHALFQKTWGNDPATGPKVRAAHRDDPRFPFVSGFNIPEMQNFVDRGMNRFLQTLAVNQGDQHA